MFTKRFLVILVGCALALSACGSPKDSATQSSPGSKQKANKRKSGKPQITADVVNIKLGMSDSAIKKKLAADGWELKDERKKQENVAGLDPIIYPERLYFGRMVERDGIYDYETLSAFFSAAPLPGKEPLVTGLMFDRRSLDQPTDERLRVNRTMGITAEYVTSMLAVAKKKYGEPHRVDEGACTGRSGTTQISIPFYEVVYHPETRNYNNSGGLIVKIGDACRQNFSVSIGDGDFARDLREQFTEFAKKQLEKSSANTKRAVDF